MENRNTSAVDILLRFEVGLPFVTVVLPLSLIFGMVIVIVNYFTENRYHIHTKFRSKLYVLAISAFFNGAAVAIGLAAKGNYVYLRNGMRFVDYGNIKAGVLFFLVMFIVITLSMLSLRVLCLLTDHYILARPKQAQKSNCDTIREKE